MKAINKEELRIGITLSTDDGPFEIDSYEKMLVAFYKDCRGIRITEELLEANGFQKKGNSYILRHLGCTVKIKKSCGHYRCDISGEPLHEGLYAPVLLDFVFYLHQLQNACLACRIYKKWVVR